MRREESLVCRRLRIWGDSVDAEGKWQQKQKEDENLAPLLEWMETSPEGPGWPMVAPRSHVTKHLWQQWALLRLEGGVLQRRWDDTRGRRSYWVVLVPWVLRRDLLQELQWWSHQWPYGYKEDPNQAEAALLLGGDETRCAGVVSVLQGMLCP